MLKHMLMRMLMRFLKCMLKPMIKPMLKRPKLVTGFSFGILAALFSVDSSLPLVLHEGPLYVVHFKVLD